MTRPVRVAVQIQPGGTPDYATWRDAVVAADGDLAVNSTPVQARSVGLIDAGHRTLGLTNRSDSAVHMLLLGGQRA